MVFASLLPQNIYFGEDFYTAYFFNNGFCKNNIAFLGLYSLISYQQVSEHSSNCKEHDCFFQRLLEAIPICLSQPYVFFVAMMLRELDEKQFITGLINHDCLKSATYCQLDRFRFIPKALGLFLCRYLHQNKNHASYICGEH